MCVQMKYINFPLLIFSLLSQARQLDQSLLSKEVIKKSSRAAQGLKGRSLEEPSMKQSLYDVAYSSIPEINVTIIAIKCPTKMKK